MKHALRLRLIVPVLAFIFPAIALADLSQTRSRHANRPQPESQGNVDGWFCPSEIGFSTSGTFK
jgi:hypothetical protein